jgi:hypothetical protein
LRYNSARCMWPIWAAGGLDLWSCESWLGSLCREGLAFSRNVCVSDIASFEKMGVGCKWVHYLSVKYPMDVETGGVHMML